MDSNFVLEAAARAAELIRSLSAFSFFSSCRNAICTVFSTKDLKLSIYPEFIVGILVEWEGEGEEELMEVLAGLDNTVLLLFVVVYGEGLVKISGVVTGMVMGWPHTSA